MHGWNIGVLHERVVQNEQRDDDDSNGQQRSGGRFATHDATEALDGTTDLCAGSSERDVGKVEIPVLPVYFFVNPSSDVFQKIHFFAHARDLDVVAALQ